VSMIGGRLVDRYGKRRFLLASVMLYVIGMFVMYVLGVSIKDNMSLTFILTLFFAVLMMGSYLFSMVILNAMGRDLIPETHIGVFSGIRMIFFIMIPMVIGPFIGSSVIRNNASTYIDEFGIIQSTPNPGIYLAGAVVALLAFIPIRHVLMYLKGEKHETAQN
jgi:MFS family permease